MSQLRTPCVQTRRDAWVEINISNVEHNVKVLKSFISGKTKFLAVVKADAYGHGASMLAPTLQASGVDMFGVASVDEGIQLRNAGITAPILVLGSAPSWAFVSAVENDICLSVFSEEHIIACKAAYNKLKIKPKVHIKVDTGMHRIGISHELAEEFVNKLIEYDFIDLQGVFTHLANSEFHAPTQLQIDNWNFVYKKIKNLNLTFHMCNTAALMSFSDIHYDMVRAGIGLYGLMPDLVDDFSNQVNLKQAMSLKARIVHIQQLNDGCGVSYGHTFVTNKPITKVATVPLGYADGVSRSLSNKIKGILNGTIVNQIGNVTMDQMMFDVSAVPDCQIGDIITLLGEDEGQFISINEWAKILNTINYEITCKLRVRLPRVYSRD